MSRGRRRAWWILILALLLPPSSAHAYTCGTGCTFTVNFSEPTTLTNGQALTDLSSCAINWTRSVDGASAVAQTPVSVPASKPQGGGAISKAITDSTAGPGHTYTVQATVACTSTAYGTGTATAPSSPLQMNNGVTTNPPTGLTVQ